MFAARCVARDSRISDPGNSCELEKAAAGSRRRISASRPGVRGIDNHKLGAQKNAPASPGRFRNCRMQMSAETEPRLRGGFGGRAVDDLRSGCARDRNAAGLLGLGNLANEIDVKQAVLKRSVLHYHEIGQLERALEG